MMHTLCLALITSLPLVDGLIATSQPSLGVRSLLARGRSQPSSLCAAAVVDVLVRRDPATGLGIEVDASNVVATCAGQPDLSVGDKIVAVNGEPIGEQHISAVLAPADEYTFTVERGAAGEALELVARKLCADIGDRSEGEVRDALIERLVGVVGALEASPLCEASALDGALRGFWSLAWSSDEEQKGAGLTGYGLVPSCTVVRHWQCFAEKTPARRSLAAAPADPPQRVSRVLPPSNL